MKWNLISISQFCKSNNTCVEFLPTSFRLKDLQTGALPLQGRTRDGVYEWPASPKTQSSLIAFSNVKASLSDSHHCLRHPSESIFRHTISKFQLGLTSGISHSFSFNDYYCNKSHKLPFVQSALILTASLQIFFLWVDFTHLLHR